MQPDAKSSGSFPDFLWGTFLSKLSCNLPGSLLGTSCLTNMPETLAGIGPDFFPGEGKLTATTHIFEEGVSEMFGNRKFQIDSKNMKKS